MGVGIVKAAKVGIIAAFWKPILAPHRRDGACRGGSPCRYLHIDPTKYTQPELILRVSRVHP